MTDAVEFNEALAHRRARVGREAIAAARRLVLAEAKTSCRMRSARQLGTASAYLRKIVCNRLADGLDTTPFWCAIDSINFACDSMPGRWRYMTDEDRQRRLDWAEELIGDVREHVRHQRAMQALASAAA
jgi:hypothetical protein